MGLNILESVTNYFTAHGPEGGHESVEATFQRATEIGYNYLQHEVALHYGPEIIAEDGVQSPDAATDTKAGLGAAATQQEYDLAA